MVKVYVGNLSYDETDDSLAKLFTEFGDVHTAEIVLYRKSGKSRGFGFVEMDRQDAEIAIENLNGKEINGRVLKVNISDPSVNSDLDGIRSNGVSDDFARLYVGNMHPDHDVAFLAKAFSDYGRIMSAMIINDGETGEPEGFGFVEMEDNDSAVRAISELDGREVDGVRIRVNWAKPKQPSHGSGFSRKRY